MLAGFDNCIEKALHRPVVYAHRGGALLWPGNTTLAFDEALNAGADVLEMDVRATSDNVLVVIHNRTVDETTDEMDTGNWFSLKIRRRRSLISAQRLKRSDNLGINA